MYRGEWVMDQGFAMKKEKDKIWDIAFEEIDSKHCYIDLYLEGKITEPKNKLVREFFHISHYELLKIKSCEQTLFLRKYKYEIELNLYLKDKYHITVLGFYTLSKSSINVTKKQKNQYSSEQLEEVKERYATQLSNDIGLKYEQVRKLEYQFQDECPYFDQGICSLNDSNCSVFWKSCLKNTEYIIKIENEAEKENKEILHKKKEQSIIENINTFHWTKETVNDTIVYSTQYDKKSKLELRYLDEKTLYSNPNRKPKHCNRLMCNGKEILYGKLDIKEIVGIIENTHPTIKKQKVKMCILKPKSRNDKWEARQKQYHLQLCNIECQKIAAEFKIDQEYVKRIVKEIKANCRYNQEWKCDRLKNEACAPYLKSCIYYDTYRNKILNKIHPQNRVSQSNLVKETGNANGLKQIDIKDFLIRTNVFKCMHSHHNIENIDATVCVDNDGKKQSVQISAGYCKQCNIYFIMESIYQELKRRGIIL